MALGWKNLSTLSVFRDIKHSFKTILSENDLKAVSHDVKHHQLPISKLGDEYFQIIKVYIEQNDSFG